MKRRPVAIFISRFPPPAESFLVRELDALERQGQPVLLVAMLRDHGPDGWRERALIVPWISMAIVRALWRKPGAVFALLGWIFRNTLLQPRLLLKSLAIFPMAAELAERLAAMEIAHVHAHFATHAGTMAVIVSKLSGIRYSLTAHAHAIFVSRALLREKVRDAVFVRTISEFNRRFLESLYPVEAPGKVHVVRVAAECRRQDAGGAAGSKPALREGCVLVACSDSSKPHKGVSVFLEAARLLEDEGVDVRCEVGDPGGADVFVQPSVIAPNGQMDGIPVPLIDAMAGGKAVIASAISGIPEVVVHEETGLLVDPANPRMLADAIRRLAADPALRARLGARAREKVTQESWLAGCTAKLIALFDRHNPELPA